MDVFESIEKFFTDIFNFVIDFVNKIKELVASIRANNDKR